MRARLILSFAALVAFVFLAVGSVSDPTSNVARSRRAKLNAEQPAENPCEDLNFEMQECKDGSTRNGWLVDCWRDGSASKSCCEAGLYKSSTGVWSGKRKEEAIKLFEKCEGRPGWW